MPMNTKRIFTWAIFILIIGLITWGMVLASKKADREAKNVASVDAIIATDNIRGATTSKVTMIEYSDFQCPACGMYFPMVEKVVSENIEKVVFVYRHFPLTQHANAIPASKAAEAAGKQGKFWEMYEMIFTNQKNWEESTNAKVIFESYAKKLNLDMDKYSADLDSKEIMDKINNDQKSGIKAGVNSTPTFFINGKKINNPQTNEQFKKLIEETYKLATNP